MRRWMRAGGGRPRQLWRLPMMKRSVAPVNLAAGRSTGAGGGRSRSLAVQLALHCPCWLTNTQINAHTCFCYYTCDDIIQSSQSYF